MTNAIEAAVHILREVTVHALSHVLAHAVTTRLESSHLTSTESKYVESLNPRDTREGNRVENDSLRHQLEDEHISKLHQKQQEYFASKLQELQAAFDENTWPGIISRHEAVSLLSRPPSSQAQIRLVAIAAEPTVSELCPLIFREELAREIRSKTRTFVENLYPSESQLGIDLYAKFFRREVFDTEIKQLEFALAPINLATIVTDVTRREVTFHLRLVTAIDQPVFISNSAYPWKIEHTRLVSTGLSDEAALDAVVDVIVSLHKVLTAFLIDYYFLCVNPFHQIRIISDKVSSNTEIWIDTLTNRLDELQQRRIGQHNEQLKRVQALEQAEQKENERFALRGWGKAVGSFRVSSTRGVYGVLDMSTNTIWFPPLFLEESVTFREAEALVKGINVKGFLGFSDWRLPTRQECKSLSSSDGGLSFKESFSYSELGKFWYVDKEKNEVGRAFHFISESLADYFAVACLSAPSDYSFQVRIVRSFIP